MVFKVSNQKRRSNTLNRRAAKWQSFAENTRREALHFSAVLRFSVPLRLNLRPLHPLLHFETRKF
jgi:hypothetical protein